MDSEQGHGMTREHTTPSIPKVIENHRQEKYISTGSNGKTDESINITTHS
jgi:hypothetical protein